jgi:sporulation-control protein spo0M
MFDLFKGGKAQVNLTLDRNDRVYLPGETVNARVNVVGEKDIKIQEGRITFLYSEEYQYRHLATETDSHGHRRQVTRTSWKTEERPLSQTAFLPETTIAAGTNQNFEFAFTIPPNSPPSVNGNIIRVKWLIKATLDRKLAGDIEAHTEISVVSTSPNGQTGEGRYGNSSEPLEAELQLGLPSLEFVLGETIAGTLTVTPQKGFDVSEARLALVQRENVPQAQGNTHDAEQTIKLSSQLRLQPGQPVSLPFKITIPTAGSPSCQTPNGSIAWHLVGTLARRLRKDTTIEESISVYSRRA